MNKNDIYEQIEKNVSDRTYAENVRIFDEIIERKAINDNDLCELIYISRNYNYEK
ncbi:hypothetical protein PM724_11120 [Erysipelatoclostridium ramosum]|uniref:hypothetical protein n=1 Tax=Thomasclavelia ramosa TaxID=1547 RepID=UPI001314751D|nr:hypothetical protein [Thomasclavelia ramosa]MCI7394072.1 hypothetical protein [Thomasclavelia ramosa]MDB7094471.1 hypothetical protein [Thomasclavelia ramosa]